MKTLFPLLLVVVNAFQTTKPFRPLHYESRVSIAEGIPNRCLLRRAAIDDNDDDTFDLAASESSSSSSSDDDPPITDLYGELGLKRRASSKEITTAFRKLALQWHPDRNRGGGKEKEAAAKFLRLLNAYTVLSDPDARKDYDRGGGARVTKRSRGGTAGSKSDEDLMDFFGKIFGRRRGGDADGEAQLGGDAAEIVDDDALLLSGDGFTASDSMEYGYGDWEDGEDVEAADVDDFLRATMDPEGAASGDFNLDGVGGGVSWDSAAEGMDLESFLSTLGADSVMAEDAKLGTVDSHELVELDEDGEPYFERFVFVDEASCIGCTNCACVAPATFFMEDDYGRARVFQQQGDATGIIKEAIETCPVDCIHYVPWEELRSLEGQRRGLVYENTAIAYVNPAKSQQLQISGNNAMRCGNCPGNGCAKCPMYGVGANPEYVKKRAEKRRKRAQRERESLGIDDAPTQVDL